MNSTSCPELSEIIDEAEKGKGLPAEDILTIFEEAKTEEWKRIFLIARALTEKNFEKKLSFFAPLYFSNFCVNDCHYCGFRRTNRLTRRRALTASEFVREAEFLWGEGHRTLLLIAGEHPRYAGTEKLGEYLWRLRRSHLDFSLMAEVGPLDTAEYRFLGDLGVRQVLLFQETYDRATYSSVHEGPKRNFDWRLEAMERALSAGMERVGLGILVGLHDYREDLAELVYHAHQIEEKFGRLPATFSFPRLRPAPGISFFQDSDELVTCEAYEKMIALVRLALPSVGIVLSTREGSEFRDHLLDLGIGVTHLSAGSSTVPGGYTLEKEVEGGQFNLLDHRPLKEVAESAKTRGYQPIFHFAGEER